MQETKINTPKEPQNKLLSKSSNFLNSQNYILGKSEKRRLLRKYFFEKNILFIQNIILLMPNLYKNYFTFFETFIATFFIFFIVVIPISLVLLIFLKGMNNTAFMVIVFYISYVISIGLYSLLYYDSFKAKRYKIIEFKNILLIKRLNILWYIIILLCILIVIIGFISLFISSEYLGIGISSIILSIITIFIVKNNKRWFFIGVNNFLLLPTYIFMYLLNYIYTFILIFFYKFKCIKNYPNGNMKENFEFVSKKSVKNKFYKLRLY